MTASPKKTCGVETHDGSPCKNLIDSDEEACHLHDEDGPPEGHGVPEGNDNAVGNEGGAPVGNFNAVTHAARMDAGRRLEYIRDEGWEEDFSRYFRAYKDKTENETAASELATTSVIKDLIEEDLFRNGLWEEVPVTDEDGNEVTDPETGETVTRRRIRIREVEAYKKLMTEIRRTKDAQGVTNNDDTVATGHENARLLWDADAHPDDGLLEATPTD